MPHTWETHAQDLAARITHPGSRWWGPLCSTPRHLLVPRWWEDDDDRWTLRDGSDDPSAWLRTVYSDRTLVTKVGPRHADHAAPDDATTGRPTSSSTLPGLLLTMYRHAHLYQGADVLDVGVGSGYGTALLSAALGGDTLTAIDVDPYLVEAAADRLGRLGVRARLVTGDATEPLPGSYDRIVSTVAVRPIPPSWLEALRPGGRLVTTLTGINAILTATKTDDAAPMVAKGRIEWDRAGFMSTRSGPDYPPAPTTEPHEDDADESIGRYPVVEVDESWELRSMLEIDHPGITHRFEHSGDRRTAWMSHPDGSWARATAIGDAPPLVHQASPRRLWDALDDIRHRWLTDGELALYGARAWVSASGTIHLARGSWRGRIGPA
ncbi:methyltransferase domain-containing protein [Actinomadura logoneensis]|uniref:Protein-L-isoaspartate O-methyltransferase n=1 Tax=Actinomadura logoneensis TaxID=2293572 RepID=A0A372JPI1_9ACTN|nr:methyltransferase domain-containing protein [Actinomadura logoneensis]RFU41927.1 methyltransferase domain-containing protein [Actinomadura logoneensis]